MVMSDADLDLSERLWSFDFNGIVRLAFTFLMAFTLFLNPWDNGLSSGLNRLFLFRHLAPMCALPLLLAELIRLRRINVPVLFAMCFLSVVVLRGTDVLRPDLTMYSMRCYATAILAFVAIVTLDLGHRHISIMIWAQLLGCAVAVVLMLQSGASQASADRAAVENVNANHTAYCCVLSAALGVLWMRKTCQIQAQKGPLVAILIAIAVALFGVILTATRGAFIGAVPVLVALAIYLPIRQRWVKVFLLVAILAMAVITVMSSPVLLARLKGGDQGADYASNRMEMWITAFELFQRFPVFGIGPGNFAHPYSEYGISVHNVFLSILAEMGAVGFLFWLAYNVSSFFKAKRQQGLLGAVVFFFPWFFIAFSGAWEHALAAYAGIGLLIALGDGETRDTGGWS